MLTGPAFAEGTREIVRGAHGTETYDPTDDNCYTTSGNQEGDGVASCAYQGLRGNTDIRVDVLDTDEFGVWCTGKLGVDMRVLAPDGSEVGTFARGARIDFDSVGTYRFDLPNSEDDPDPGYAGRLGDMSHVDASDNSDAVLAKFSWDVQVFSGDCSLTEDELCPTGMGGVGFVDRDCELNGRVFSEQWWFNAGSFDETSATNASWYAVVPGGEEGDTAVTQLELDGLAGFVYAIWGNRIGVEGQGGRSVHERDGTFEEEFPMYLNPPEDSNYTVTDPLFDTDPEVSSGVLCGGEGTADLPITVASGFPVDFNFESNVEGTIQLVCDLNGDDRFDLSSDEDVQVFGTLQPGENTITWLVQTNEGEEISIPEGDDSLLLECILRLTVGEFHYVGNDMETSYPGLRLWQVNRTGTPGDFAYTRSGVEMHWNDTPVEWCYLQPPDDEGVVHPVERAVVELPESSGIAAITSGREATDDDPHTDADGFVRGVSPGTYGSGDAVPHTETENGNSRAWGNFRRTGSNVTCYWVDRALDSDHPNGPRPLNGTIEEDEHGSAGNGRGNDTNLDTLTWLSQVTSDSIFLRVIPPRRDTDDDGVFDYVEECKTGSDIDDCDTDDDGVDDNRETNGGQSDINTDGDDLPDVLDYDDDNDCIDTIDEVLNGVPGDGEDCTVPTDIFTDSNAVPDRLDDDDDGDTVLTIEEGVCDDDGFTTQNTDDDAFPDHLDPDDDGDTIPTEDEDVEIVNDDPTDDDTDDDGTPNYLDVDDDGDCILTADEDLDEDLDPTDDDFDFDDVVNYLDPDDDGDTVPTRIEGDCDESGDEPDYTEWDTDEDEDPDHLDINDDDDARDTIDEDPNGNDDPTDDDSDGDRIPDYLDADDQDGPLGDRDNDGVPNRDDNCPDTPNADQSNVDGDDDGDVCDDDIDGDEIPNDDDNCPTIANVEQEDFDDDGEGDVCDDDRDGDGEPNEDDNCPDTPNPEQEDINFDGIGDTCQGDADEDGIPDVADNCVDDPNTNQGNVDGDAFGDVCDDDIDDDGLTNDEETDTYGTDPYMADTDGGGVPDGEEVDRRTDPLDPGDDPGAYEVTGGSAFTCSSTSTDGSGWFGIMAALAGLVFIRRRREER